MSSTRGTCKSRRRGAESGAVAVEFAILGPVFLILVIGTMVWGQYFWISHAVQQLANDSARAALAGLDSTERASLARTTLSSEVTAYANLRPSAATMAIADSSDSLTVSISYDASSATFWAFAGLVPAPPRTVLRQATVRLGGY
jgi:Flp pilus assembly protein TadG